MSIVRNIIYAITHIHCCFSSNIISRCATCFSQIEMFLIQCYNSTVRWATFLPATKLLYTSAPRKTLFKTDHIENAIFYSLALTRIESKASLYSKGCTAFKQTY